MFTVPVVPVAVVAMAYVHIAAVPIEVVPLQLCHRSCAIAVVPITVLPLQEARKTVTAGAVFRPFPGDDWQAKASGELLLLLLLATQHNWYRTLRVVREGRGRAWGE